MNGLRTITAKIIIGLALLLAPTLAHADVMGPPGGSFIYDQSELQTGAIFHVASGTVVGPFTVSQSTAIFKSTMTLSGDRPVSMVAPINGQAIVWDSASGFWKPGTAGGGGGGTTIWVQAGDVDVDVAVSTMDFNTADFSVTSSPSGEANIALVANSSKFVQNRTTLQAGTSFYVVGGTMEQLLAVSTYTTGTPIARIQNAASPAVGIAIPIQFLAANSATSPVEYGVIDVVTREVTNGTVNGQMRFAVASDSARKNMMEISSESGGDQIAFPTSSKIYFGTNASTGAYVQSATGSNFTIGLGSSTGNKSLYIGDGNGNVAVVNAVFNTANNDGTLTWTDSDSRFSSSNRWTFSGSSPTTHTSGVLFPDSDASHYVTIKSSPVVSSSMDIVLPSDGAIVGKVLSVSRVSGSQVDIEFATPDTGIDAILNQDTLQTGATFYVSSGTVHGGLSVIDNNLVPQFSFQSNDNSAHGFLDYSRNGTIPYATENLTLFTSLPSYSVGPGSFKIVVSSQPTPDSEDYTGDASIILRPRGSNLAGEQAKISFYAGEAYDSFEQEYVLIGGKPGASRPLRFYEGSDNGSSYTALKSSDSLPNSVTFVLPVSSASVGTPMSVSSVSPGTYDNSYVDTVFVGFNNDISVGTVAYTGVNAGSLTSKNNNLTFVDADGNEHNIFTTAIAPVQHYDNMRYIKFSSIAVPSGQTELYTVPAGKVAFIYGAPVANNTTGTSQTIGFMKNTEYFWTGTAANGGTTIGANAVGTTITNNILFMVAGDVLYVKTSGTGLSLTQLIVIEADLPPQLKIVEFSTIDASTQTVYTVPAGKIATVERPSPFTVLTPSASFGMWNRTGANQYVNLWVVSAGDSESTSNKTINGTAYGQGLALPSMQAGFINEGQAVRLYAPNRGANQFWQFAFWETSTSDIDANPTAIAPDAQELDDLGDVALTSPQANDVLKYINGAWVNDQPAELEIPAGLVPYTGATTNVALGAWDLTAGNITATTKVTAGNIDAGSLIEANSYTKAGSAATFLTDVGYNYGSGLNNWVYNDSYGNWYTTEYPPSGWTPPTGSDGYVYVDYYGTVSVYSAGDMYQYIYDIDYDSYVDVAEAAWDIDCANCVTASDLEDTYLTESSATATYVMKKSTHIAQGTFDLASQWDVDSNLWLMDLHADSFPSGITITRIYVDANVADPTTELDANLMYCNAVAGAAFPGASATLIKAINTTTGNFADAAVNVSVASGKSIYIDLDADPVDAATQYHIRIHYVKN